LLSHFPDAPKWAADRHGGFDMTARLMATDKRDLKRADRSKGERVNALP
jgi:hypothetical protein